MKKLCFIFLIFLICKSSFCAPVIVSYNNGQIVCTGAGSKSQATPIFWDTFDGGSNGVAIQGNAPTIGSGTWGSDHNTPNDPIYSSTRAYSGSLSFKSFWQGGASQDQVDIIGPNLATDTYFVYFKRYMEPSSRDISLCNVKTYYFTVSTNGYAEGAGLNFIPAGGGVWGYYNNSGLPQDSIQSNPATSFSSTNNKWQTWECYAKMNDPAETSNGVVIEYLDGIKIIDISDYQHSSIDQVFSRLSLGNMYKQSGGSALAEGEDATGYYDDVYIDSTQQRVIVAKNADGTGNREIQPYLSSWSDIEITLSAWNQGTFTNYETVYLFVIDADGNVSNGIAISGISQQSGTNLTPTGDKRLVTDTGTKKVTFL